MLVTHAAPSLGVHAMQIEVCRSVYLDSSMEQPSARLVQVSRLLAGMVQELGTMVAMMGRGGELAQAAE